MAAISGWRSGGFWQWGVVGLIGLFALGPVIAILVLSFDVSGAGQTFRFGWDGYRGLISDPENLAAFGRSLALTVRVPIGMALAIVICWLIVRVRVPGHRWFEYLFWFAFFLPTLPMLTGWILLLDANYGLINGWFGYVLLNIRAPAGIVWAQLSLQTLPVLVVLTLPALRMIDRSLESAAVVAGARGWRVFWRVIVPIALPGLLTAGLAAWIRALESFEVERVLGGYSGYLVLTGKILNMVSSEPPRMAEAMATSSIFLVILLVFAIGYNKSLSRRGRIEVFGGEAAPSGGEYSRRLKWAGTLFLTLVVVIMILLPLCMLLLGSMMKLFGFFSLPGVWTFDNWRTVLASQRFHESMRATLALGLGTATIGVLVFAIIAWVQMHLRPGPAAAAGLIIWLPWAFPGLVLGLGILEISLGLPGINLLYGTMVPLVFGLLIRELPIGVHLLRTTFLQGHQDLVEAARVSGGSWGHIFWRVLVPLNGPALAVVFLLIFSVAIRDVGTIILVAPPGLRTLSLMTFDYASGGQFEKAAVVGTLVAVLALLASVPAFWLAQRAGRQG